MFSYRSRDSGLLNAARCATGSPAIVSLTATSTFLPLIVYYNITVNYQTVQRLNISTTRYKTPHYDDHEYIVVINTQIFLHYMFIYLIHNIQYSYHIIRISDHSHTHRGPNLTLYGLRYIHHISLEERRRNEEIKELPGIE